MGPADYDNDGDIDFFATNVGAPDSQFHALYENNGDGTYTNVGAAAGTARFPFGWGCALQDYDNDGFTDLFFAGSLPLGTFNFIGPTRGNRGTLLFNRGDKTFADFSMSLPVDLSSAYTSGVAAGDYDRDGFVDLVIGLEPLPGQVARPVLLHNGGDGNHWITVQLEGTRSNRDGVGARIEVVSGTLRQVKEVYAGTSFLSMDSQWLTFGLGDRLQIDEILIHWPSGQVDVVRDMDADQRIKIVEGQEGFFLSTAVLEECLEILPSVYALEQNSPNPFNSATTICYALPVGGVVKLVVYNLTGQKVATLIDGQRSAGAYTVHWDGRDDRGLDLASGIYLYRLRVGSYTNVNKLLLLR